MRREGKEENVIITKMNNEESTYQNESKNKREEKNKPKIKRQTPLVQSFFCVTQYNKEHYIHAHGHTHISNENGIPYFTTEYLSSFERKIIQMLREASERALKEQTRND